MRLEMPGILAAMVAHPLAAVLTFHDPWGLIPVKTVLQMTLQE